MAKYMTPALDKGLDILEYLSEIAVPQSQIEISQGINKTPNEIYRMLVCLEERGYLNKDSATGKFSLSLKLYQLSHRHSPVDEFLKASKPIMELLSNTTKQSCHIGILYDKKLMVISQTRSPGPVSLSIEEGSLFPLHKTTSGRVLLAFMPDPQRGNLLEGTKDFVSLSQKQRKAFLNQLEEVKAKGYDMRDSEITHGVIDIATPVGSANHGIYAALAISSLSNITDKEKSLDFLVKEVKNAAHKINEAIGVMKPTIKDSL
ncbi:IclR family transcriptional regulator [Flammeovirgaceae bacterium SG7u.111]|nr:IclR family transcriptional regulator [Flammeovirgaceae bacterium SG7u.132]WPO37865.1 IclR family transcriptional regulator [Flammeovirgaceae bacterium SG7u.111]